METPSAGDARTDAPVGKARRLGRMLADGAAGILRAVSAHFRDRDPGIRTAFVPALLVSALLFVRSPLSNYIFDEQEALLANPFVNGRVPWKDVLTRDFWGLPSDRSIGSYRPLPNVVWRVFWQMGKVMHHPWALHWVNIVIHALNAACVARILFGLTRNRAAGWLAGASFATSAVLTEAVTGVVGIADVFGALGLLLAVLALEASLPAMALAVFGAVTLGLFSKESSLVALPIVAWAALASAPIHHPERPLRALRALVALATAALALALYTETRRRFFPTALPPELADPLPGTEPWARRVFHAFLRWFQQPRLPQDPINNPFVRADLVHRVSGALGVYASGLGQVFFPLTLSGDYSYAAEPVPLRLWNARSILGGVLLVVPPLAGVVTWLSTFGLERRNLLEKARTRVVLAIALVWVPVAYFPHSNIPVTLPTVRAERFWYLPVCGAALALGVGLSTLLEKRVLRWKAAGALGVAVFLGFQAVRARVHAFVYTDDLVFWRATARAVPKSAKAHLNYGVMLGARGDLQGRLVENRRAMEIAPAWAMAHVYYADTLCRLGKTVEAWPHYRTGMTLGPNDRNLIALSLQCLWDKNGLDLHRWDLSRLADSQAGTWLAYLVRDVLANGREHGGVDKKHRPRGYDEGPAD